MPFSNNPNYEKNPELIKKIYELRTKGERWNKIAETILIENDLKISNPTIKNIYERYVAKNLLVNQVAEQKEASEFVPDFQQKMEDRFNRITKVTDDLMDTLEEMKSTMEPAVYVKYVPTILMVCREILNQLSYIKKEQTQVLVNQKNLIYSPLQIMNIVNTELVKLEKAGKIEIKKTAKNGRVLQEEEKADIVFTPIKSEEEIENENT